jgi:hypothetical protein
MINLTISEKLLRIRRYAASYLGADRLFITGTTLVPFKCTRNLDRNKLSSKVNIRKGYKNIPITNRPDI